jgi:ubiquinone/menaquinone biosynthesis C-methylase UbiE
VPAMSRIEQTFCRSAPWRLVTQRLLLPWALHGAGLSGEVLEIGGGSGAMAEQVLERFPEVRMTITDYDEGMVASARERLARFGERVTVRTADATSLPFGDARFDALLSFIMLHHVLDWERALAEAVRVLRPGGTLAAYDLLSTGPTRWIHRIDGSRNRLMDLRELERRLSDLPLEGVHIRPALGRLAVRFHARTTKS